MGASTAVPVIENDESRRLVRSRRHAEQAAESLLADPGIAPDVDGDSNIRGNQADAIGELGWRLLGGRRIDQVASEIDSMADDFAATDGVLELGEPIVDDVGSDDQAELFERMTDGFGLPHSRPASAGNRPFDQGRRDERRFVAGGQYNRHPFPTLGGKSLGQSKARRKCTRRVEPRPRPQPDQKNRACTRGPIPRKAW